MAARPPGLLLSPLGLLFLLLFVLVNCCFCALGVLRFAFCFLISGVCLLIYVLRFAF